VAGHRCVCLSGGRAETRLAHPEGGAALLSARFATPVYSSIGTTHFGRILHDATPTVGGRKLKHNRMLQACARAVAMTTMFLGPLGLISGAIVVGSATAASATPCGTELTTNWDGGATT
jgi:hypothetical protein